MSERFTFTIDVQANAAAVTTLTAATQQQTAATNQLRQAEQARLHLPMPDMVIAQQRKTLAVETTRALENERSARLQMGQKWAAPATRGSMGQAGGAGSALSAVDGGRALLEGSRAIEDAQYGIAGVLNNLPGLVMMLGGGAGLAGALSVAGVAAAQLVKHLGGVSEAVNEEQLKAKMAALQGVLEASLNAMSARMAAQFEKDLAEAQEKATAKLEGWKASMSGVDATAGQTKADSGQKDAAFNTSQNAESAIVGMGATAAEKAQTDKLLADRAQQQKDNAAKAALEAEALAARQRRQIAEQGVRTAQEVRVGAEAVTGPFGFNALSRREEILGGLRKVGVKSDQEQLVNRLSEAEGLRDTFLNPALAAEQKRDSMSPLNPLRIVQARKAASLRGRVTEAEQTLAALAPGAEDAQAALMRGEVTFTGTDPKKLTPAQQRAFAQGTQELDQQRAKEEQAQKQAAEARQQEAEAQRALDAARRDETAVKAAQNDLELNRASRRISGGELPDIAPEKFAALQTDAAQRGGQAGALPLPLPSFAAPDLSGTEQAFAQAMDQTSTAVTTTMERMVGSSETMAQRMAATLNGIQAKLAALEANLSNLVTQP